MRAVNHALTGAIIGLTVDNPAVAVGVSFLSHYICDAIPHYDPANKEKWLESRIFGLSLVADAVLCGLVVLGLALLHPRHWLLAAVCAFLATAPDFFWVNNYLVAKRGQVWKPNVFSRFALWIQWFARPIGAFVEVAWAGGALILLKVLVA